MAKVRLDFEERRRAIVAAAMPLFARKGFAGTTTKEIARAAGVSEALVFQHFPSKAALYREIHLQGCEGDPALEQLNALEPCTRTLVRMTEMLVRHVARGDLCDPVDSEVRSRLLLNSFLEDGEYGRLIFDWVMERVFPKFQASFEAAAAAGDMEPQAIRLENAFWFGHHVAALFAIGRLCGRPTVPYAGGSDRIFVDMVRFVLRGIGLRAEVIAAHLDADAASGARARANAPEPAAA